MVLVSTVRLITSPTQVQFLSPPLCPSYRHEADVPSVPGCQQMEVRKMPVNYLTSMPEVDAYAHIGEVVKAAADAQPRDAYLAVVAKMSALFDGHLIAEIVAAITAGYANGFPTVKAILAALAASGIVLPPWASILVDILLKVTPAPAA